MNVGEYLVDRLIKLETENAFYEREVERTNEELIEMNKRYAALADAFIRLKSFVQKEGEGNSSKYRVCIFKEYDKENYDEISSLLSYPICEAD